YYSGNDIILSILPENLNYAKADEKLVDRIIDDYLIKGIEVIENQFECNELVNRFFENFGNYNYFNKQLRLTLRNCGIIDPESLDDYFKVDGFKALAKVLTDMTPQDVIDEIKKSGLRGRGGGGYPTFQKWTNGSRAEGKQKYIICNADEGDPGAFMDRSTIEGDPFSVIEGMAIAGYAVGADKGFVYIRAEYPLAIKRLKNAIKLAKEKKLIGKNILDTNFSFDVELRLGAGAFVCGEETALIASIEGKRGMPRPRPPYPSIKGLFGNPTVINNVETLANVPAIILIGGEWFSRFGIETSKGTKVFALAGKVNNTGLIEIPMGTTLREIIFDIGGGIKDGHKFKAVQTGGPSGGCLPEQYLETPVDYDTLNKTGSIMGSGGMIVMDEHTCMVDVAKFFLDFTQNESCGKCTPCREGTKRMLEILERICNGKGEEGDIEKLERLGETIKLASLCGLGQTAPNPVLSNIKYFRDEFEEHIKEKKCRAKVCKKLLNYIIVSEKCVGCGVCKKKCPVNCITGEPKKIHNIDSSKCIKCGACFQACKFNAIIQG
ncbi:NADH-quinone oxidoreductase subunit NuoF, partial [Candidatus Dependentiae bacterium]|nr:NADH-quinone oxidoreductase subunit NuoF [Candidatus Dependentiae bacterium]